MVGSRLFHGAVLLQTEESGQSLCKTRLTVSWLHASCCMDRYESGFYHLIYLSVRTQMSRSPLMLSCSSKYEGTLNGFAYLYPFTRKCIFNKNSNRCEMIRLQNRLLNMSENRVNETVFLWKKSTILIG